MFFSKQQYTVLVIEDDALIAFDTKVQNDQIVVEREFVPEEKDQFHFKDALLVIKTNDVVQQEILSKNALDALEEAFPAIRASEIYYDYQNIQKSIISIIKKIHLDELLNKHGISEKYISHLRLAPSLHAISSNESALEINELVELAVASIIKDLPRQYNFEDLETLFKDRISNKRFFEITKWSAIAVFLIGLTANFFYHEKYRKQLDEARIGLQSYKNIDKKLATVKSSLEANELLISSDNSSDMNTLRSINNWIVNQVGISFDQVTYQPLRSKINNDQEVRLEKNQILIEGKAKTSNQLDEFISFLKVQSSINDCSVISIEELSKFVNFKLELTLDETR